MSIEVLVGEKVIKMLERYGSEIVKEINRKYEVVDEEEILKSLKIEKKKEEIRSKIPMPFKGEMCKDKCNVIRLNYGLYTQCQNKCEKKINGYDVCKTCIKQTEKNSNGKPTYGYIQERIELGKNFKDPKGKSPIAYGNVMERLKLNREEVEREATRLGIELSEEDFEISKKQRGRPKKETAITDTSSEEGDVVDKKPRGRPKKEKKPISETIEEEINNNDSDNKDPDNNDSDNKDPDNNDSDDDEEGLAVTEFTHMGKKYLKAQDNTLYDFDTHEELGTWNPEKRDIVIDN